MWWQFLTAAKFLTLNHHCGRRRFRWWCITLIYCVVTVNVEQSRWFYRCPSEHFSTSEIQLTSPTGFYILLFSVCVEITLIHIRICWRLTDDIHWAGLSYDIWRHFYMRRFYNNTKQTITWHLLHNVYKYNIIFYSHDLCLKKNEKKAAVDVYAQVETTQNFKFLGLHIVTSTLWWIYRTWVF